MRKRTLCAVALAKAYKLFCKNANNFLFNEHFLTENFSQLSSFRLTGNQPRQTCQL